MSYVTSWRATNENQVVLSALALQQSIQLYLTPDYKWWLFYDKESLLAEKRKKNRHWNRIFFYTLKK